ncbi:cytochrome P450 81E8-like [Carica papaya]|uniref:cytochrome P450 81E8-like n=1 Tax=Carica papaya TaxID=3649 RepID=UPI000B8CCAB6|nr:cytochrome P450 81E8-like [Carica papaya]
MAVWYLYSLLIFLAISIFTRHFLNKIRNLPPTPFPCLPIIGHLYLLKPPIYRTLSRISKRNGGVFLLQFGSNRVLVVSSPSAAEECFTKNDIVFANRPHFLIGKHLAYNFTIMSWAPYGDHWRNLRRISCLELLSPARLQMLYHIRADEVRTMIRNLLDSQHRLVDLRTSFFESTLNTMMGMIAGKRYYDKNVEDVKEANRFREIHVETSKVAGLTAIGDFLPWIKSWDVERRMIECQKKTDGFMQDLIEEGRRKMKIDSCDGERKKTMIDVLLSLQESEPEYYSDLIIKGLMLILLLAGTDTTISTMEWTFSLLLNHPEELIRAQIEIDNHISESRLLHESDLAHLPYLRCIINEAMRMYPATPLLAPHRSSAECSVGGFCIPAGTTLMVNAWAIQNDPNVWANPTKFKPERFREILKTAGAGTKDGFCLMPFGYGRRSCPGDGLAMKVMGLTLGSLIQCFEWTRVDEEIVDMTEGVSFTLQKAKPLQAKCRPRATMADLLSGI